MPNSPIWIKQVACDETCKAMLVELNAKSGNEGGLEFVSKDGW